MPCFQNFHQTEKDLAIIQTLQNYENCQDFKLAEDQVVS